MPRKVSDAAVYARVVDAFKRKRDGATAVDIVGLTGLPLEKVKEATPAVADEFGARLRVTESGEVLYSFPSGFKSRYRGFVPTAKRVLRAIGKGAAVAAKALFKVWIVVMLVGYFVLFMAIALVALLASVAVSASGSSDNRSSSRRDNGLGGLILATHVFDLIIRIWFYSELAKSFDDPYGRRYAQRPPRRPLHQAVFSFVFGDGDPNADWETRERKAVVAYIQANRGVIALPEFMAITGKSPAEAEEAITAYLVEFGGSPEATEEGTIVYRFDELLRHSDTRDRPFAPSTPLKKLKSFSSNPKKLNGWFIALNGANFLFGLYFLSCSIGIGPIVQQAQITGGSYLYAVAYLLFAPIANPQFFTTVVLGVVPLAFAALFYLIPGLRVLRERDENERMKMENLRKDAYRRIWDGPKQVKSEDFKPSLAESKPADLPAARERIVVEMGSYAQPEVAVAADGSAEYSFPTLQAERSALDGYRASMDLSKYELGKTVFDSHE